MRRRDVCTFTTSLAAALLIVTAAEAQTAIFTPESGNNSYADARIGRIFNNGTPVGFTSVNHAELLMVGDDSGGSNFEVIYRSFVGFNTSDLSPLGGQPITSVKLRLFRSTGTTNIGPILVDLFDFGSAVDSSDYDAAPVASAIGTFAAAGIGFEEIDVTSAVLGATQAGRVQFRLRATLEQQQAGQNLTFFNGSESRESPQLIVRSGTEVVPEPGGTMLFLPALGTLWIVRRRHRASRPALPGNA